MVGYHQSKPGRSGHERNLVTATRRNERCLTCQWPSRRSCGTLSRMGASDTATDHSAVAVGFLDLVRSRCGRARIRDRYGRAKHPGLASSSRFSSTAFIARESASADGLGPSRGRRCLRPHSARCSGRNASAGCYDHHRQTRLTRGYGMSPLQLKPAQRRAVGDWPISDTVAVRLVVWGKRDGFSETSRARRHMPQTAVCCAPGFV